MVKKLYSGLILLLFLFNSHSSSQVNEAFFKDMEEQFNLIYNELEQNHEKDTQEKTELVAIFSYCKTPFDYMERINIWSQAFSQDEQTKVTYATLTFELLEYSNLALETGIKRIHRLQEYAESEQVINIANGLNECAREILKKFQAWEKEIRKVYNIKR